LHAGFAGLILGDQSCKQLRQLARQISDRRTQKWVIRVPVEVMGHRGPFIAFR